MREGRGLAEGARWRGVELRQKERIRRKREAMEGDGSESHLIGTARSEAWCRER